MTLAEAWEQYKKLVVPKTASADMEKTIKYTFYCGANFALLQSIKDENTVKSMQAALKTFLQELQANAD